MRSLTTFGPDSTGGDAVDWVCNGNRWRVLGVNADTNRVSAEPLTGNARVILHSA
jgi:hypothetical protein